MLTTGERAGMLAPEPLLHSVATLRSTLCSCSRRPWASRARVSMHEQRTCPYGARRKLVLCWAAVEDDSAC